MLLSRSELLVNAIIQDEFETVKKLLESGLQPNLILQTTLLRASALAHAASLGRLRIVTHFVQRLLDQAERSTRVSGQAKKGKCHLDFRDPCYRRTPLHEASLAGHQSIVDILINNGSDMNCQDNEGNTPLILAASFGQTKAVHCLLNHGASVLTKNRLNATALHYTTYSSPRLDDITVLLISAGCLTNKYSYHGIGSPLANLLSTNNYKLIKYLIKAGYDTSNDYTAIENFLKNCPPNEVSQLLMKSNHPKSLFYICKNEIINNLVSVENKYKEHLKDKIRRLRIPRILIIDTQLT